MRIPDLPLAAVLTGAETLPIVQGGASKRVPLAALLGADYATVIAALQAGLDAEAQGLVDAAVASRGWFLPSAASIATALIPAGITEIDVGGLAAAGDGGHGRWVSDALAIAGLAAVYPALCKMSVGGRYWRVKELPSGHVPVRACGVIGTTARSVATNHQPGIATANSYAYAVGAKGLYFDKPFYCSWAPLRTAVHRDLHLDQTGVHVVVPFGWHCEWVWDGVLNIVRRAPAGGDPNVAANWSQVAGVLWRGPYFFQLGLNGAAPTNYSERGGLYLAGKLVRYEGGIPRGSSYGAVNNATGDGWDTSDWFMSQEPDRVMGHLQFDTIEVDGCRGEPGYLSNDTSAKVVGNLWRASNTNAQGINPNSCDFRVKRVEVQTANMAIEGWTGKYGFIDLEAHDCVGGGSLQAGSFNGSGGSFANFSEIEANKSPTGTGQIKLVKCGNFKLGSGMRLARIECQDSSLEIGNSSAYPGGVSGTLIDTLVLTADRVGCGVNFGPGTTAQLTKHNRIGHVIHMRTPYAVANAIKNGNGYTWSGSLGPKNIVERVSGDFTAPPVATTSAPDYQVHCLDYRGAPSPAGYGAASQNIQTTGTLQFLGPLVALTSTGAGNYNLTLGTTNVEESSEMTLVNITGSSYFVLQTGGTRLNKKITIGPNKRIKVRFDGGAWNVVEYPPLLVGFVLSTTVQKAGAAIPAGDVSDTYAMTVSGAAIGMHVKLYATSDLGQDAMPVGRVSATGTVTFRVANLNLGATLAPASTNYIAEVEHLN